MSGKVRYFIGVDPSINHTGWAVVEVGGDGTFSLLGSGVQRHEPSEGDGRIAAVYRELRLGIIRAFRSKYSAPSFHIERSIAIIEKPHFEDKRKSRHIFQLVAAAGACVSAVTGLSASFAFVTASQWKRNLPKYKIKWRVEQLFPHKADNWAREDEYEAVGLALWGNALQGEYEVYNLDGREHTWTTSSSTKSTQRS